jgi:hypothetical protein
MAAEPYTMTQGKMAVDASRLMEDGRYRHLPVVDDRTVSRLDFSGTGLDRLDEEIILKERL